MNKFDIYILDHLVKAGSYTTFSEQACTYFQHAHDDAILSPILEIVEAWYQRLRYYYFSMTYTLVGTDDYQQCREFIIFDQYKISNHQANVIPTLEVKNSHGVWQQIDYDNPSWHLTWLFQSLNFRKGYQVSEVIQSILEKLVYRDLFGIDLFTANPYSQNIYANSMNMHTVLTQREMASYQLSVHKTHMHFFSHLMSIQYGKLEQTEDAFKTKKAYKQYKKTRINPRYISQWHSKNTEDKINQIFARMVNKDVANVLLHKNECLSINTYIQEAAQIEEYLLALNAWKDEHRNKWFYMLKGAFSVFTRRMQYV